MPRKKRKIQKPAAKLGKEIKPLKAATSTEDLEQKEDPTSSRRVRLDALLKEIQDIVFEKVPLHVLNGKEYSNIIFFTPGNIAHRIVQSFLTDCQKYPKILYHKMFTNFRSRIENETPSTSTKYIQFPGEEHDDFTYLKIKEKVTPQSIISCKPVSQVSWCSTKDLKTSECRDSYPVQWTAQWKENLFYLEPFFNLILQPYDSDFPEEWKQHYDENLTVQYKKMLDILLAADYDESKVESRKYEEELSSRFPAVLGEISGVCCDQTFTTVALLFSHFRTTHGLSFLNSTGKRQSKAVYKNIISEIEGKEPFKVHFGWNTTTCDYGMWTSHIVIEQ